MRIVSTAPVSIPFLPLGTPVHSPTLEALVAPLETILPPITPLVSGCNRRLTFTFEYQLRSLIYYHIEECTSAQAMLQKMAKDSFVHHLLVPPEGLGETTFYEANATRGAIQMLEVFDRLAKKVFTFVPYTMVWNVTGQPSMSVPIHWNRAGLPIGTMFTARFGGEASLLAIAAQLERARPWADRVPAPQSGA